MPKRKSDPGTPSTLLATFCGSFADGLTILLAVCTGMWMAEMPLNAILSTGSIIAATITLVMLSGSYLVEKDVLKDPTKPEQKEWERLQKLFEEAGFTEEQKKHAEEEWQKEKEEWDEVVYPGEEKRPQLNRIWLTGFAFLTGGILPMLLLYLLRNDENSFRLCLIVSIALLIVVAGIKEFANRTYAFAGVARTLLIGLVALAMAMILSRLFMLS